MEAFCVRVDCAKRLIECGEFTKSNAFPVSILSAECDKMPTMGCCDFTINNGNIPGKIA